MNKPFSIDSQLICAYESALYNVDLPGGRRTFTVGADTDLGPAHIGTRVAVVTACNPFSILTSASDNQARHQLLLSDVTRRGLNSWPALGCDGYGEWPAEISLAVQHSTPVLEDLWMRMFDQNAVLVLQANQPAKLRWHPGSTLAAGVCPSDCSTSYALLRARAW